MPMPKALLDELTKSLKDVVYDGQPVLKIVTDSYNKAEKFESDNKDIIAERDKIKGKLKEVSTVNDESKTKLTELEKQVDELKNNQLSDEDKKLKDKGLSPEMEAKFNTLNEQINNLTTKLTDSEKAAIEKDKRANEYSLNLEKVNLNSDIRKSLATVGIKDPKNQDIALALINQQGMAQIKQKEDGGGFDRNYLYHKDGSPYSFEGVGELANHIKENYKNLVDSSGNAGTGENHNNQQGGAGSGVTTDHQKDLGNFEQNLT